MTEMQKKAIEAIEAQQPKQRTTVWMVGEQLKDIIRHEPDCAAILLEDLGSKSMSLEEAEKKIKERADKNKVGRSSCVTPIEAEEILRKFYGLPDRLPIDEEDLPPRQPASESSPANESHPKDDGIIDIFDFLGR